MGEARGKTRVSGPASVRVNGRRRQIERGLTIAGLLEQLEITARYALVERNGEPVRREQFSALEIEDGDEFVVARPVAGG